MSYIYLCTNNNYNKYKCKSFNNFIEANKYILQYKLAKLFINVNIDNN